MSFNYASIQVDCSENQPGVVDVLKMAPIDTFTNLAVPGVPAAAGDTLRITADHTFGAPDGFVDLQVVQNSGEKTGEGVGETDSHTETHTLTVMIKGSGVVTQEWLTAAKMDRWVVLYRHPGDPVGTYQQLGTADIPARLVHNGGGSGKHNEGARQYEVTLTYTGKVYEYTGVVTDKP